MPKKPVVVKIDPNRISFESKTITKEDTMFRDVQDAIDDIPFT